MKLLRTADTYREVIIGDRRITGDNSKVSDKDAKELTDQAAAAGIVLVTTDTDDADATPAPAQVTTETPDLSAGVGAITGGGNVVTNDAAGVVVPEEGANPTSAGTAQKARS